MSINRPVRNRIQELDALRGIALLGILLVNIFVFHAPLSYYSDFYGAFEGIQATAVNIVVELAGGKFLLIFAFLFGYGIVLQEHSKPIEFKPYFVKRMITLLFFGLIHILLFWFGDILASYALLGLLVLPLIKLSNQSVLTIGILFIFFRPIYYLGVLSFDWPMIQSEKPATLNEFITVFQEGTYIEIFKLRMLELVAFMPENLVWYIPKTFGLFLIGIYAARKSLLASIKGNKKKYLASASILITISLIWIYYKSDLFHSIDLDSQPIWRPILIGVNVFFETTLGIGYIFGFSLIFQSNHFFTRILSKTGRLALTNYIIQSLICVIIFYGYGLGYYAKLRPTDLVLISFLIFSINLGFSFFYLKFRPVGPLEFLWRKLIKSKIADN
ncbi:MAG: DUF418 domain-containing protein [Crocinitomicaceae bacterium]